MADNNVDLLDLNDDLPELDGGDPFASENKNKNIWKLAIVGVLALAAAGYVVYKLAGKSGGSRDEVAAIVLNNSDEAIADTADIVDAISADPDGLPQKVIEDRKDVKFNPAAGNITVSKPKPLPAGGAPKSAPKPAPSGAWSAQVGSFSSRVSAEREQKHLQTAHKDLFGGKTISIISATLPNGDVAYRLRVPNFTVGGDANAFCQRAKARGLNCYAVPTGK
jgi:cell division septation protein DedD